MAFVTDGGASSEDAAVAARGYLRSRGALTAVVREMAKETARLGRAEAAASGRRDSHHAWIPTLDSGALAGRLAEVLVGLVADFETIDDDWAAAKRSAKRLASTPGAIATATRCVLALRSLVGARTADATAAERTLSALLASAVDASAEARRIAIAAAVAEARRTGPAPLDPPGLGGPADSVRDDGERSREEEGSVGAFSSAPPAPAGHVLSWLARLVLPDDRSEDASYSLRLVKSATQEEFIRGQMTKNPYDSAEHSLATMRDVKNFVCVSLDMHGLCDDDFGMELLVAGKIVSLDLPVAEVFEHVWRRAVESGAAASANGDDLNDNGVGAGDPRMRIRGRRRLVDDDDDDDDDDDRYYHAGNRDPPAAARPPTTTPPMVVTYRLQGLDGEATEEMVSEIDGAGADADEDPEITYAVCAELRERRGLEALLSMVPVLSGSAGSATASPVGASETAGVLMRLLRAAAELTLNRRAMLRARALPALLAEAGRLFGRGDAAAAKETGNELLLLVERLLTEETTMAEEKEEEEAEMSISDPVSAARATRLAAPGAGRRRFPPAVSRGRFLAARSTTRVSSRFIQPLQPLKPRLPDGRLRRRRRREAGGGFPREARRAHQGRRPRAHQGREQRRRRRRDTRQGPP